jgi:hypothetical protein
VAGRKRQIMVGRIISKDPSKARILGTSRGIFPERGRMAGAGVRWSGMEWG